MLITFPCLSPIPQTCNTIATLPKADKPCNSPITQDLIINDLQLLFSVDASLYVIGDSNAIFVDIFFSKREKQFKGN